MHCYTCQKICPISPRVSGLVRSVGSVISPNMASVQNNWSNSIWTCILCVPRRINRFSALAYISQYPTMCQKLLIWKISSDPSILKWKERHKLFIFSVAWFWDVKVIRGEWKQYWESNYIYFPSINKPAMKICILKFKGPCWSDKNIQKQWVLNDIKSIGKMTPPPKAQYLSTSIAVVLSKQGKTDASAME